MKIITKIVLGILTFTPIIFLITYSLYSSNIITKYTKSESAQNLGEMLFDHPEYFIIATALINLGVMIYYLIHAMKNPKNEITIKIIWSLLLLFFNPLSLIAYYFIGILPSEGPSNELTSFIERR